MGHQTRIMYIENKGGEIVKRYSYTDQLIEGGLTGPARIGRVTFSKTGATLYYQAARCGASKAADSSRTTTTSRQASISGYRDRRRMGKTPYTQRMSRQRLMRMCVKSTGLKFGRSRS